MGFLLDYNDSQLVYEAIFSILIESSLYNVHQCVIVKTAEPIGPKFCVGPHITPGKVYERSKLQKFVSKSLKMREKKY